tara:strand:+ start:3016 stop:3177 length:162 start_codon:yes stop_codon:yes gene_type:complete
MRKRKKKYYEILSKRKKYRYGIFPFTDEGHKEAKDYIKVLSKIHNEKFFIEEK